MYEGEVGFRGGCVSDSFFPATAPAPAAARALGSSEDGPSGRAAALLSLVSALFRRFRSRAESASSLAEGAGRVSGALSNGAASAADAAVAATPPRGLLDKRLGNASVSAWVLFASGSFLLGDGRVSRWFTVLCASIQADARRLQRIEPVQQAPVAVAMRFFACHSWEPKKITNLILASAIDYPVLIATKTQVGFGYALRRREMPNAVKKVSRGRLLGCFSLPSYDDVWTGGSPEPYGSG